MNENPRSLKVVATAIDPIYIGTGGYTIGRVDNTIVRDPISNLPKIPGSSLAGTWRYYLALEMIGNFKEEFREWKQRKEKITEKEEESGGKWFPKSGENELPQNEKEELLKEFSSDNPPQWHFFTGNAFARLKCAGQDDAPNQERDSESNTGHCGHCIVCKGFGFSKKDLSWQGMLFFSDLEIVFFPVFTMEGTKWVTTERIIEKLSKSYREIQTASNGGTTREEGNSPVCIKCEENISENERKGHINLGWLYLPYRKENREICSNLKAILEEMKIPITLNDIVIVPDHLFPHIVNSNLEVRTSVSIDPLTGTAKEGALFTSEAIPRGTIFHGEIRIFDKSKLGELESKIKPLPEAEKLESALKETAKYYETLGIGGMTTRGFGRMRIELQSGNSGGSRADAPDGGDGE